MKQDSVKKLSTHDEIMCGPFAGRVTCIDLTDDDKIVVKWDCAESEDVLSDASPLWGMVGHGLMSARGTLGHDIVERLRRPHCVDISVQKIMDEAADIIDRLRARMKS
jgi:hypothetical protein